MTDTIARDAAYEILDQMEMSSDALPLALEALRLAPALSEAYAAAAGAMRQDSIEAAVAWSAAREIARRDLGERIKVDADQLWYVSFGQEYLRAGLGYALCCQARGEPGEAVAQLTWLLALDPADHLGVRHALGPALLAAGRLEEFERLRHAMSGENQAYWLYVDALHAILARAPAAEQRARMARALASNEHVPGFLLSDAPLDPDAAPFFTNGGVDEACAFAASLAGRLWRQNGPALRRLAAAAAKTGQVSRPVRPRRKGP